MSPSGFEDLAPSRPQVPGPAGVGDGCDRLTALVSTDLEACLALDAASLGGLWSAEQWRLELADPQRPGIGLRHGSAPCEGSALCKGSALLAMACGAVVVDELHITLVAVSPHRRRQGLGLRVLRELLGAGRRLGAERATLEVSADNTAALALYGRCGFSTAGVRRRYYRDGSDALIQWSCLDDREVSMSPASQVG